MLGGGPNCLICNTRPVMLYTCCGNGTPWAMPIDKDNNSACSNTEVSACSYDCSNVFRVEKLDDCCATCRVLTVNSDNTYTATNSSKSDCVLLLSI